MLPQDCLNFPVFPTHWAARCELHRHHQVVDTFADSRDRDILNLAEEMEQDLESDKLRLQLNVAVEYMARKNKPEVP